MKLIFKLTFFLLLTGYGWSREIIILSYPKSEAKDVKKMYQILTKKWSMPSELIVLRQTDFPCQKICRDCVVHFCYQKRKLKRLRISAKAQRAFEIYWEKK